MQEELTYKLMKTFNVNTDQAARLLMELKQCVKRKNLVSISDITEILCNFSQKRLHQTIVHLIFLYPICNSLLDYYFPLH